MAGRELLDTKPTHGNIMFVNGIKFNVKDPCVHEDYTFGITLEQIIELMQEGKITSSSTIERIARSFELLSAQEQ